MTTTRRIISDSYIKPNNTQPTCPVQKPKVYETRRVISNEYLKPTGAPAGVPYCGRTVTRTPVYTPSYIREPIFLAPQPIFVPPQPVYIVPPSAPIVSQPIVVTPQPVYVASHAENIAGALLLTAAVVGVVALIVLVPYCYKEEVCKDLLNGYSKCHGEEVCTTLWDRFRGF